MKLNEIKDKDGAVHSMKLVGRGIGSGKGKTSGKGHKGQKARGTGKVEIAELLEQSLDYGILRDAVNTHSEKDLQGALGMVLRDKSRNLSAEQKKRFTNLSNTVTELADFREENKNSQGEVQMIDRIRRMLGKPSAITLAQRELEEAERLLLRMRSQAEYTASMVGFYEAQVERLSAYTRGKK